MQKVIITKGIPASSKTTWAKQQIYEDSSFIRVNKDDLREMLHNSIYSKSNENFVLKVRDFIIQESLRAGKNIIIDDTNLNLKHETQIRSLVDELRKDGLDVELEIKWFPVDLNEAIQRDLQRKSSVGQKVIRDMYQSYLKAGGPEVNSETELISRPKYNPELPDCIISDLDGTLALFSGKRSPYDASKCADDEVNEPVALILEAMDQYYPIKTILVSGRDEEFRPQTLEFLDKYRIHFDQLYMRKNKDVRKDSIVKREIYEQYIKDKYNVICVLDDRNQTTATWRYLGLTCFQVADGNF